jgi:hypothetical protein
MLYPVYLIYGISGYRVSLLCVKIVFHEGALGIAGIKGKI